MGANQGMSAVQVEGNQTAGAFARLAIVQKDPNNKIPTNAVARPVAKITENATANVRTEKTNPSRRVRAGWLV